MERSREMGDKFTARSAGLSIITTLRDTKSGQQDNKK